MEGSRRTVVFDRSPGRPPRSSRVEPCDACTGQLPSRFLRQPASDLLDNHRDGQLAADCLNLAQQAFPLRIPLRLDGLLQHIKMQHQRVSLHHLDGHQAFFGAVALVELDRAQVSKQQDIWRDLAHLEGVSHLIPLDGHSL